jgi:hypothetical protein
MKIIYSPGYGAGWSTWARGFGDDRKYCIKLATDNELIHLAEAYLRGVLRLDEFVYRFKTRAEEIAPERCYFGAIERGNIAIAEIPDGIRWRIVEYDGYENVETETNIDWWA